MKLTLKAEHREYTTDEIDQEIELVSHNVQTLSEALDAFSSFLRAAGFEVDTLEHVEFEKDMQERFEEYIKE